jgi:hypothetical protein
MKKMNNKSENEPKKKSKERKKRNERKKEKKNEPVAASFVIVFGFGWHVLVWVGWQFEGSGGSVDDGLVGTKLGWRKLGWRN